MKNIILSILISLFSIFIVIYFIITPPKKLLSTFKKYRSSIYLWLEKNMINHKFLTLIILIIFILLELFIVIYLLINNQYKSNIFSIIFFGLSILLSLLLVICFIILSKKERVLSNPKWTKFILIVSYLSLCIIISGYLCLFANIIIDVITNHKGAHVTAKDFVLSIFYPFIIGLILPQQILSNNNDIINKINNKIDKLIKIEQKKNV